MKSVTLLIVCLLSTSALAQWVPDTDYTTTLNIASGITLKYKLSLDKTKIQFYLQKTAAGGWFAFGLGSSMSDADILKIEQTAVTFVPILTDCKLTGQMAPTCSEINQAWQLKAAGSYSSTVSTLEIEFWRNVAGSGEDMDKSFVNGSNTIVWAHGTQLTVSGHASDRGTNIMTLDLTMPAPWVPATDYTGTIIAGGTAPNQNTIKWKLLSNTQIQFLITKPVTGGWFGFGLGSSMADADIVKIEQTAVTFVPILTDCKLTGQMAPTCGETNQAWTLKAPNSYSSSANMLQVEIIRNIAASGADMDKAFMNGANSVVWAHGTSLTVTGHAGVVNTNFGTSTITLDYAALANKDAYVSQTINLGPAQLQYKCVGADKVQFYVKKNGAGYFAFGLGENMSASDIVVIKKNDAHVPSLDDCRLSGTTATCGESNQAWTFRSANSFLSTSTSMEVELIRNTKIAVTNESDMSFKVGENKMVWAHHTSNSLTKHATNADRGTFTINLVGCGENSGYLAQALSVVLILGLAWVL